jgi:hypothetical protein
MRTLVILGVMAALAGWAGGASAWEVRLDLDTDNDPATINEITNATSAVVRIVLAPTSPYETITEVTFGLGGSCHECEMVQHYGVEFDLIADAEPDWLDNPLFTGTWSGMLLLGCPGDPGYHFSFTAVPVAGSLVLEEPVFLAAFNAWVAPPPPFPCSRALSNLAAMFRQGVGGYWNYVQIGGAAVPVDTQSWGVLKSTYNCGSPPG